MFVEFSSTFSNMYSWKTSGIVLRISFHEVKKEVSVTNKSLKKYSLEVTTDNGQKLSYKRRTVMRTKNKCF